MAAQVPQVRPEPTTGLILSGDPVVSQSWMEMGLLANYLRGTGACLVPSCFPDDDISAGSTGTYTFRTKPRDTAIERVWVISISASSSGGSVIIRAPASSGTPSSSRTITDDDESPHTITYTETLGSKSASEAAFSIDVQAAGQAVVVNRIECYEQSRPVLTLDTTDYGVDLTSLRPTRPILDIANRSIPGVIDAYKNADARRVGGLHWAVDTSNAVAISASTFGGSGYHFLLHMPLIGRKVNVGDTTSSWSWSVYAEVDSGATGEVEVIDGGDGNLDTITVTSTGGYAWVAAGTFDQDAEDLDETDGIRGGTWGNGTSVNFRARRASGTAGAVRLASVSVWDAG